MIYVLWAIGLSLFVGFGLIVLRGAPYVPTHRAIVRRAFETLHPLSDRDLVVDLGAGDGVVLDVAREYGARGVGYELNPWLWLVMKYRFRRTSLVKPVLADYTRLAALPPGTTVVYVFATSLSIGVVERCLEKWSTTSSFVCISYGFKLSTHTAVRHEGPMYLYIFTPKT